MSEPITTRFEADLVAALDAYAEAAAMAVDPMAVAGAAAAAHPRRRTAPAILGWRTLRPALMLAALLALLIAMLIATGSVPLPSPDRPALSRLMVSDGTTTWIVGPDRTVLALGRAELPRGGCGWLIGGTDTLMGNSYSTWAFTSLSEEPLPSVTASASYGGGERWSPDRRKVALVAVTEEQLTILDFSDPADPVTTTWELPGLIGAGWMPDSDGLLVAQRLGPDAVTVQRRALDGTTGVAQTVDIGPGPAAPEMEMIEIAISPDGHSAVLAGVLPDPAIGTSAPPSAAPLPVLAEGELQLLGPVANPSVAWDTTSRRTARLEGTTAVVTDATSHTSTDWGIPLLGPPAWLPGGWLVWMGADRIMVTDPDGSRDGALLDKVTDRLWAVAGDRIVDVRVIDGVLRVRWYRADGSVDGTDLALTDPGRTATDPPTCLDVQPLPE